MYADVDKILEWMLTCTPMRVLLDHTIKHLIVMWMGDARRGTKKMIFTLEGMKIINGKKLSFT